MIKTVLIWAVVAMVASVVLLLFINGGGIRSIVNTARSVPNLREVLFGIASSSTQFQLPGQEGVFSDLGIEPEFEGEATIAAESKTTYIPPVNGSDSPYRGTIELEASNAYAENARDEYLSIYMTGGERAAVTISGWSIVSMTTGVRLVIPLAATPFLPGTPNRVDNVVLASDGSALIFSGVSPIGVSYRENQCTQYLPNMQSYGTCANQRASMPGFYFPSWRLYAGYSKEIWKNSSDTLRLLDATGRIVDESSY